MNKNTPSKMHPNMLVPLEDGTRIFTRTRNGWLVGEVDVEANQVFWSVYQDPTEDMQTDANPGAASLSDAFYEQFESYMRTKYSGGLEMVYEPKGRVTMQGCIAHEG